MCEGASSDVRLADHPLPDVRLADHPLPDGGMGSRAEIRAIDEEWAAKTKVAIQLRVGDQCGASALEP